MLYAIVHKGRVVLGALAWSQKYYTSVLKIRHRIDAKIPNSPPETFPFVIDENTQIREVVENKPIIDTMTQSHYGPLWDLTENTIVANYEVQDLDIVSARNNFKQIAAFERYKKENSGAKTTIQGVEVSLDTSRDGRNIFLQKYSLMGDADIVNWKFPEGWLTLTKEELGLVVMAGAQHIQAAFDWEKGIDDQIEAAQNAEELHAIVIVEKPEEQAIEE